MTALRHAEQAAAPVRPETRAATRTTNPGRGLVDRDSFLRLNATAQENLLRQTLLLYLTALELANHNPDDWESAAFVGALDHLAARAPLLAYDEVARMLLPVSQRPPERRVARVTTGILRVQADGDSQQLRREKLDRNGMRRRLLQLSAIQLSNDVADAKRSVVAQGRRRQTATAEGNEAGD
ncbi:hypothetical protein [Ferrovibrio sp.]|uniref:hypothetical protein n=1 Tax=Ferrovibrio sp. TaxID=1917215 RepID=UPI000CABF8CB|nr:hypothetical protein [Ferrovibrio sp.]PJI37343.1 MAG: hypothetical protein CTR53_20605 [Ferrovibrio sp.]